jgi:hypothetical protein
MSFGSLFSVFCTLDERMSLLETRLKEVVSKPHTKWEDSTNSTNLNLIQENIELKRENHHMKLRLTTISSFEFF